MGTFNLLDSNVQKSKSLHLDAHAIENLDIFEVNLQTKITSEGSLMSFIDYTRTPFGRRMLKRWLAYPLKSIEQIEQRQEALEDLMAIDGIVIEFDKKLNRLGDLERQISKVFNSSQSSRLKPSSFENFSSQRLKDAFQIAKDIRALEDIFSVFADIKDNFKSDRLKKLCAVKDPEAAKRVSEVQKQLNSKTSYLGARLLNRQRGGKKSSGGQSDEQSGPQEIVGLFPDLKPFVEMIEGQLELDENGFCQPKVGADRIYDEAIAKIKRIYKKMNIETIVWRKKLNNFDIKLVKSKMQWEIQIPEHLVEGMKKPKELHLTSKVKGYQRFQSDIIIRLCTKLKKAEQHLQKALSPFCERFFFQFYKNRDLLYQVIRPFIQTWVLLLLRYQISDGTPLIYIQTKKAINCIGELDCLCSLAKCANSLNVRCKPTFVPQSEAGTRTSHTFDLQEMYHPQMMREKKKNLVPNDTVFEDNVVAMLVTGPNMGGKSTLLRQTCLAVILAQIGSYVPARSFTTSIKDRIFCRIGASDRLLEGKSTFLVEMEETGDIVKEATRQSIVLLDELGRGTSTFDGVSIAYGVLRYIVEEIQCLTLFSTHYHMLVDEFRLYDNVENYCMDYEFVDENSKSKSKSKEASSNSDKQRLHFKYKFIKGFSEKSFGINVAKMASLPNSIIEIARKREAQINSENENLGNLVKITQSFNEVIKPFLIDDPSDCSDDAVSQMLESIKI